MAITLFSRRVRPARPASGLWENEPGFTAPPKHRCALQRDLWPRMPQLSAPTGNTCLSMEPRIVAVFSATI